jgi:nuclear control of ATPase protein 2
LVFKLTYNSQVRRVDGKLDRLQLLSLNSTPGSPSIRAQDGQDDEDNDSGISTTKAKVSSSPRILHLQAIAQGLSATSSSTPLLRSSKIVSFLQRAQPSPNDTVSITEETDKAYEQELEWLIVGKATVQTYGVVLNLLVDRTLPLVNDIWYWDEIIGSYRYTALYSMQTSPLRLWSFTKDIYADARRRFEGVRRNGDNGILSQAEDVSDSLIENWKVFYGLVRDSVRDRSIAHIQQQVLSPFAIAQAEARKKQAGLRKLREMSASGLGVLMDEGLSFDDDDDGIVSSKGKESNDKEEWKGVVEKSVALMESVLRNITTLELGVADFEDTVFTTVADDGDILEQQVSAEGVSITRTTILSNRLQSILQEIIPTNVSTSSSLASQYGRPSRIIRYWIPATVLFLSSSTILRIAVNRKEAILAWVRELGSTVIDFWYNWVVEPTKKLIGTIRHDEDSEVALMSKESLRGDKDSLERMVVDFAVDNPTTVDGSASSLNESQIADVKARIKEGDLTPVLKAYERDLKSPVRGAVGGQLIRALLIQVQKTKVDVEVAIGGIDALLKSQELVFGFVGLTPSILICVAVGRWVGGTFGGRKGVVKRKEQGRMMRTLR